MFKKLILVTCFLAALSSFGRSTGNVPSPELASKPVTIEKPVASTPLIKGSATMKLKNQHQSILNQMELVLVPSKKAAEFKAMRDERWRISASRANFNDGYNNLDLNALGLLAVRHSVLRAKTDDKGLFQFESVPVGSYLIYGQYKSKYAAAYWLVPVEIKKVGDVITLNLNESNIKEAHNRFN